MEIKEGEEILEEEFVLKLENARNNIELASNILRDLGLESESKILEGLNDLLFDRFSDKMCEFLIKVPG